MADLCVPSQSASQIYAVNSDPSVYVPGQNNSDENAIKNVTVCAVNTNYMDVENKSFSEPSLTNHSMSVTATIPVKYSGISGTLMLPSKSSHIAVG